MRTAQATCKAYIAYEKRSQRLSSHRARWATLHTKMLDELQDGQLFKVQVFCLGVDSHSQPV